MELALSSETQELLQRKLQSGSYGSADEVLHAALEALETESAAPALDPTTLDAIDASEGQFERGEVHEWDSARERVRSRFLGS